MRLINVVISTRRISKIPWNQHQVFFRMIVRLKFNESFNIFGQTFLSTSPQMNWMTFFVLYNIGFVTKCYIIWCFVRHDSWMKRELRTFKSYYVAQHSWGTRKRVFWENPMSTKRASRNFYESDHFFSKWIKCWSCWKGRFVKLPNSGFCFITHMGFP